MVYDNAQLARVYLRAYQITGNECYKRITTDAALFMDAYGVTALQTRAENRTRTDPW